VKNQKQDPEIIADALKRNDEMAEGKSQDEVAEIYRRGEKYYCAECHSELPIKQSCPHCHKELDWDRIQNENVL
jgi:hypothetical protein